MPPDSGILRRRPAYPQLPLAMLFLLHRVDLIYPVSCGRPHHFLLLGFPWWGGPRRRSPARARGRDERPRRRCACVRSSSSTRLQLDPLLSTTGSAPLLQGLQSIMPELGWFDAHLKTCGAAAKKTWARRYSGWARLALTTMPTASWPSTGSPPSSRFFGGGDPCDGDSLHPLRFRRWWW